MVIPDHGGGLQQFQWQNEAIVEAVGDCFKRMISYPPVKIACKFGMNTLTIVWFSSFLQKTVKGVSLLFAHFLIGLISLKATDFIKLITYFFQGVRKLLYI